MSSNTAATNGVASFTVEKHAVTHGGMTTKWVMIVFYDENDNRIGHHQIITKDADRFPRQLRPEAIG